MFWYRIHVNNGKNTTIIVSTGIEGYIVKILFVEQNHTGKVVSFTNAGLKHIYKWEEL